MKRKIAFIIAFMVLIIAAVPIAAEYAHRIDANNQSGSESAPETAKTVSSEASDNRAANSKADSVRTLDCTADGGTKALARLILEKLISERCSFAGYRGPTYEEEYESRLYCVPEFYELEKADDASIALIELYEEQIPILKEEYAAVIAHAYDMTQNDIENFNLSEIERSILKTYSNIEALLSLEVYSSKLTDEQKVRFADDVEIVKTIVEEAHNAVYGPNL